MSLAHRIRVAAALAAGSTFAACNGDNSTGPLDTGAAIPSAVLTQALSEMSRPELVAFGAMAIAAPVPSLPALSPSACAYDASTQHFACGSVTVSGLSLTRSYALLTAGGATQSRYDAATTDGVLTDSRLMGTITTPGSTFSIDDQRQLVLTGLLSSTHVLNGSSITHVDGAVTSGGMPISVSSTIKVTIADVTLPAGAKYPASGTITADATQQVASLRPQATHMVATFNGSSTLSITITGGPAIARCTVDLASAVIPSCAP